MKKRKLILICLLLLPLSSCASINKEDLERLAKTYLKSIYDDKRISSRLNEIYYFGSADGYEIFQPMSYAMYDVSPNEVSYGKYTLKRYGPIYLSDGNKIYDFDNAYENNIVSESIIKEIYYSQKLYGVDGRKYELKSSLYYVPDANYQLSYDEALIITNQFKTYTYRDIYNTFDEIRQVYYHGKIDNYDIVRFAGTKSGSAIRSYEETIEDLTFTSEVCSLYYAYKDNYFYTLSEAYEKNFLSYEELKDINEKEYYVSYYLNDIWKFI